MYRPVLKRRVKKRKCRNQNIRVKFCGFFGIMLVAVFLGFLTARFAVGPLLGYDAGVSPARIAGDTGDGVSEGEEEPENEAASARVPGEGYALQFGAFSSKAGAEELAETLNSQGIETEIVHLDNVYKVISPLMKTKSEALEALHILSEKDVKDVFITSFS